MRLIIPFLAASSLIACGSAAPPADPSNDIVYNPCEAITIVPADATSPAQRGAIAKAIALWRDVGLTSLTLDAAEPTQRVPISFKPAIGLFHGVYDPGSGEVLVNDSLRDRALDVTIAHEVGHAMGLAHVPNSERRSLMNPTNSTVPPTTDDERQLQDRWSCLPSP